MMPKGPKIAPAARKEWLDAYERGERIDKIARDARRTERTIKQHIERARRERDQREVRIGLLREAYQRHYEDLLAIAKTLQELAAIPRPHGLLRLADHRTEVLLEALRSHIPHSQLWAAMKDSEGLAQNLSETARKVKGELGELVERRLPAELLGLIVDEGFIESLWFAVGQAATGGRIDHMEYRVERTAEGPSLKWGAYGLSRPVTDEGRLKTLEGHHRSLVKEAIALDSTAEHRRLFRRWAEALNTINDEVEMLLLRRLLPGQCRLCPQ